MFQSALTCRIRLVTGSCSPAALTATKWPMRWRSGVFPVAIVVQMMGDRIGFCGQERGVGPLLPELREVRKLPFGHQQVDGRRIRSVEAEDDDPPGLVAPAASEGEEQGRQGGERAGQGAAAGPGTLHARGFYAARLPCMAAPVIERYVAEAVRELERDGLMLETDPKLPSLVALVAGGPIQAPGGVIRWATRSLRP